MGSKCSKTGPLTSFCLSKHYLHMLEPIGSIGEAFQRHEQVFSHNLQKVKTWRAAFTEVGNLAGYHLQDEDVHQKWIEGGNYELCIEDVRDEIWDMAEPADPLRITLADLLACKQGGTVASMLIDVRGF